MQECEDHGSGSRDKASRRPGRGKGRPWSCPHLCGAAEAAWRWVPRAQRVRSGAVHMVT